MTNRMFRIWGSVTWRIFCQDRGPVDLGRVVQLGRDAEQRREIDDHRRPGGGPRRLDDDRRHRHAGVLEPRQRAEPNQPRIVLNTPVGEASKKNRHSSTATTGGMTTGR